MSFVDDALPAAKPARLSVAAVKGRHGDSDSGTAFRKAFADMGSQTASRGLDAKESGKTGVADDATQDGSQDTETQTEVLPRLRLSSAVTGRTTATTSSEPKTPETIPQDEPAPDARSAKLQTRPAGKDAAGPSPDLTKPDLSAKAHASSGVVKTIDRDEAAVAKTTTDVSTELAPDAGDADLPLDVQDLRLSRRPGIEFTGSTTTAEKTSPVLADTGAGVPAGTSAMAALKASLARKAVSAREQGSEVLPAVQQPDLVNVQTATADPDAIATKNEAPFVNRKAISAHAPGSKGGANPAAAVITQAVAGSLPTRTASVTEVTATKSGQAKATAGTPPPPDSPATAVVTAIEAAPSRSAHASLSATARHVAAEPILSTVPDHPAAAAEEGSAATQPEAATDMRQLLALLGQPPVVQNVPQNVTARDGRAIDLGVLAVRASGDRGAGADASMASAPAGDAPAATDRKDGADRLFRFARADGTGGAVSMNVETDGRKTIAAVTDTNAARGETVTVLDARRYLGIAPTVSSAMPISANAQAVTGAIAGSMPLDPNAASLIGQPGGATGKVVNTLKIQMHPIDLGLVTATLRLRDDELQVELKVQTGEAYRQLTDDQDSMIKALRAQGFAVDQVNVVFTPSDSATNRDTAQQQTPGGQQQPAQGGRDGQAGLGAESGREQRNSGSGERNTGDRRTGHDSTRETSSASQSGISDDLYL